MSVISTDLIIRGALEAGIADLRRNSYLLDDCFGGLVNDIVTKAEYGQKEVEAAKQFILNNNLPILLPYRVDAPMFPCILITQNAASEAQNRSSLADDGEDEAYDPSKAGKLIHRMLPNFTPESYDQSKGYIELPSPHSTYQLAPNMLLVARNGNKYPIRAIIDNTVFQIDANINEDFRDAYVVPEPNNWLAHREQLFFSESWTITSIASEVSHAGWLRQLVIYCLGRYREAYLEGRGFAISSFQAGPVSLAPIQGNRAFESRITLNGDVEFSWIKYVAPKFNRVEGEIKILEMPETPDPYKSQAQKQGWSSVNDNFYSSSPNEMDPGEFVSANKIDLLGED